MTLSKVTTKSTLRELFVVALPIGNTGDLSPRARKILESVDGVLAEDTRKFREFCRFAGVTPSAQLEAFPAQTERESDYSKLFEKLKGEKWALVSDAGTPAVNDPGSWIIKNARHLGIEVKAIPGPSALTLALQWSGGFGNPVVFLGFPPKKVKKDFFEDHLKSKTLIFFDSKHNVLSTLDVLLESSFQDSKICCLRELTKEHEEYFEGNLLDLKKLLTDKINKEQVGELTFVLESPAGKTSLSESATSATLEELLELRAASPSKAAKIIAQLTGLSRDQAYEALLK